MSCNRLASFSVAVFVYGTVFPGVCVAGNLEEAHRILNRGEFVEASRRLEAARAENPGVPEIYVGLAIARAGQRQYMASAGAVRVGIRHAEAAGDSSSLQALVVHQKLAVENLLAHARRTLLYTEPSISDSVLDRLLSILETPSDPELLLRDTTVILPGGFERLDQEQAVTCFRLAVLTNPRSSLPLELIAKGYAQRGRYPDALRAAEAGLALEPDNRDLIVIRAEARLRTRAGGRQTGEKR